MKAAVLKEFGTPDKLELQEINAPIINNNELLIKVHAASVNFGDVLMRNFRSVTLGKFSMPFLFWLTAKFYFGFRKPNVKIPGNEFSGTVEKTGEYVKQFKNGDPVYGYTGMKMGTHADYVKISEKGIAVIKPQNITFIEAAGIPYGSLMGLSLIKKLNRKFNSLQGKKMLVVGAAGNIGSAIVQLANYFGAHVTGSCSKEKEQFVRSLGADSMIEKITGNAINSDFKYDIVIDITGKCSYSVIKNILVEKGVFYFISFKFKQILWMLYSHITGNKKIKCVLLSEDRKNLEVLNIMLENGDYKPVIDKCFLFEKVSEANTYFESGKRKGSIILNIN